MYSVERCKEYVTKIENADPCAAPLPIEPSFVLNWYDRYLTFFLLAIVVVFGALSNFEGYGWWIGWFISIVLFAWRVGSVHSRAAAEHPATPRLSLVLAAANCSFSPVAERNFGPRHSPQCGFPVSDAGYKKFYCRPVAS